MKKEKKRRSFTQFEKKVIHTALSTFVSKIHDKALSKDDKEYLETDNKYVLFQIINDIERNDLIK